MAKGIKGSSTLVNYNAKVEPATKALTDELVSLKVNGIGSQRELLEDMLRVYEAANPGAFDTARNIMKLRGAGK